MSLRFVPPHPTQDPRVSASDPEARRKGIVLRRQVLEGKRAGRGPRTRVRTPARLRAQGSSLQVFRRPTLLVASVPFRVKETRLEKMKDTALGRCGGDAIAACLPECLPDGDVHG